GFSTRNAPIRISRAEFPKGIGSRGGPARAPALPGPPWRLRLVLAVVIGLDSGERELWLQLQEVLLTETADVHQILDLLERSVLLPVFDDPRGHRRADAGQRLELGGRRGVDVGGDGRGDDSERESGAKHRVLLERS